MSNDGIVLDDEPIDTLLYNKNTVNMIITEKDMDNVNISKVTNAKICIQNAFRHIRNNDIFEFRKLINNNKSIVNMKCKNTYLIHESCKRGLTEFVKILLFSGAHCDAPDSYNKYPQHYAIESKCCMLIDIMFLFGHSMNVQDSNGDTPFHYAVKMNNLEMITALMIYRATPTIKNSSSHTVMDICTNEEILTIIKKYASSNF